MPTFVIHHCTLRVVRRGGWAWGEDPRRLLKDAVHFLPALVTTKLLQLWPDETDHEIAAPLQIVVPVRLSDLLATVETATGATAATIPAEGILEGSVDRAVRALVDQHAGRSTITCSSAESARESEALDEPDATSETRWRGTVLRVLLAWHEQGALAERLSMFSIEALESWHASLVVVSEFASADATGVSKDSVMAVALPVMEQAVAVRLPQARTFVRRLLIAVEAATVLRLPTSSRAVKEVLDELCPLAKILPYRAETSKAPHVTSVSSAAVSMTVGIPSDPGRLSRQPSLRRRRRAPPIRMEMHVSCALPFLLLGPLARTGYLDTVAAVLHATGQDAFSPCFATALARKVMEPPQRGWRRHQEVITAAAAFAGVHEPLSDPHLAEFARLVAAQCAPLDAVIADAITAGHDKGQPALLQRAALHGEPGLLLTDAHGSFAIAWAREETSHFVHLAKLRGSAVIIPKATANRELLVSLDEAGFGFVTDAPPTRGEHWRRLSNGLGSHFWSNVQQLSETSLLAAAQALEAADAEGDTLWHALAVERPALPVGVGSQLELSLTLAAALGLGTIAWILWRQREPTSPLLALHRFRDLDGWIRFDRDAVRVRLPLGRRHRDLADHGLLADVPNVPWLPGRVVQFSGG